MLSIDVFDWQMISQQKPEDIFFQFVMVEHGLFNAVHVVLIELCGVWFEHFWDGEELLGIE